MIKITPTLAIHEDELQFEFIRSSGPGGQHVNKSSTAAQLRFDIANSPSLPEDVRARLRKLGGNRVSDSGVLIIVAKEQRSQTQNREAAQGRLIALIQEAAKKPKKRKKTRPSYAAKQKRLDQKKQRSTTKRNRGAVNRNEY
ncbi:MAG: alternative ribosome rescue aminoacyl-tRNA hydrolase ArfB [Candidatus Promineifilaceae bacterium]